MVGPSSQISKLLLVLLFLLIFFYLAMDVQLYLRIQNYPIERNYNTNETILVPLQFKQKVMNKIKEENIDSYEDDKIYENLVSNKISLISNNDGDSKNTNKFIKSNQNMQFQQQSHLFNEKITFKSEHDSNNGNSSIKTISLIQQSVPYYNETFKTTSKLNKKNIQYHTLSTTNKMENNIIKYEDITWISCHINPLCHITVKAILLDHTNHYLFAPMATIFDDVIGFSKTKYITANFISYFHVLVAIIAARFISSDYLGYRRIGVLLFEFRTFLDDLDGHVARVKKHIRGERSEVGTPGYYIDGICDCLGCVALVISIYIFLKNNPPRRGYAQMQAVLPVTNEDSNCNMTKSQSETGVIYRVKITRRKILKKVCIFTGQLFFSSLAWNRYIATYQNMLERNDVTPVELSRQNFIFKSNIFFIVAWLWRLFNVHSLLHCVLLSIFCDKLWNFLKMIQYSGIFILFLSMCATEIHILEVQNFIFNSLIITNNNTSL